MKKGAKRDQKKALPIPTTFTPQFWEDADGRHAAVKIIKARVERLKLDCGANSYQKEILCERTAFIVLQLETAERVALEQGKFDTGVHTQMVNALMGLLKTLGLEKKAKATGLKAYMRERAG